METITTSLALCTGFLIRLAVPIAVTVTMIYFLHKLDARWQADAPAGLPEAVTKVEIDPLVMIQGGTEVVKVYVPQGATLRGSLGDRTVTEPEKKLWESLSVPVTPDKRRRGVFASLVPNDFKDCWTSLFGNRRSYS